MSVKRNAGFFPLKYFFSVIGDNFLERQLISFSKEEVVSVLSLSALISAMQSVHKQPSLLPMKWINT